MPGERYRVSGQPVIAAICHCTRAARQRCAGHG
jgi:hypothetical protein